MVKELKEYNDWVGWMECQIYVGPMEALVKQFRRVGIEMNGESWSPTLMLWERTLID